MKDSNKIIYSFFWLATGKTQMKKMNQANKIKSVDPDGEQLIFWKVILGDEPQMELTFQISPFVRFEAWDELKKDISGMEKEKIAKCLETNFKENNLEKMWSLVPAIFGINSCYELQERKSAIRFSLLGCCGEEIFERILLTILETLFKQCYDHKASASVKEIVDAFLSELAREYPVSEELNGCILRRYEKIRDQLCECFPDQQIYNRKYKKLQNEWIDATEQAKECKDVLDYYEKMFPGNNQYSIYLLYLIQEICKIAGCPCNLPAEFSEESLTKKVGLMPDMIRSMRTLYEEISKINDLDKQKEISDEIVKHIHSRHMDWDRTVINELIEKAKIIS